MDGDVPDIWRQFRKQGLSLYDRNATNLIINPLKRIQKSEIFEPAATATFFLFPYRGRLWPQMHQEPGDDGPTAIEQEAGQDASVCNAYLASVSERFRFGRIERCKLTPPGAETFRIRLLARGRNAGGSRHLTQPHWVNHTAIRVSI